MKKKEIKTIDDPILGILISAAHGEYIGKVEWSPGHFIDISTGIGITDDVETMLPRLQKRFLELKEIEPALRLKAITMKKDGDESLLETKNSKWLESGQDRGDGEDEAVLSEDDFVQKMTLVDISIGEDGSAGFGYDDGFLFFGHYIHFGVTPDNQIERPEFSG
jgi:hypothetical protein